MYLVVWTVRQYDANDRYTDRDRWVTCDTLDAARELYAALIDRDDVWTASIAAVVESTDYAPAPVEVEAPEEYSSRYGDDDEPVPDEPGGYASEALEFLNNGR